MMLYSSIGTSSHIQQNIINQKKTSLKITGMLAIFVEHGIIAHNP